jgi:hypothetical protein
VGPDIVGHLVGGEAVYAVVRPSGLIRRVVGHLVLEHDRTTVLAVPDDLVVPVVLHKKAVGGDVIPVHDQAVRGGVARPADTGAMVGPPRPDVVYDHIVSVDLEAGGGFARSSTTDAEEYVLDQRGVIRVAPRASQDGKPRQLADLEKDPRVNRTGIEVTPGTLAISIDSFPRLGTNVGNPRPSTTVSGRSTRIGSSRL